MEAVETKVVKVTLKEGRPDWREIHPSKSRHDLVEWTAADKPYQIVFIEKVLDCGLSFPVEVGSPRTCSLVAEAVVYKGYEYRVRYLTGEPADLSKEAPPKIIVDP